MSDIAQNALRYGENNTKRSDYPNPHNGEIFDKNIVGFDCSGFVCHIIIESGFRIDYGNTSVLLQSKAFMNVTYEAVKPGDIILFNGHVGIVLEYDNSKYLGRFIHMRGKNNIGGIQKSYFISNQDKYEKLFKRINGNHIGPDGKAIIYGTSKHITAFRRVDNKRYSSVVDLHIKSDNSNPTLRPLGTRVYSNYIVKTPKSINKVTKNVKSRPERNALKRKSVPERSGLIKLVKRLWGNLPGT